MLGKKGENPKISVSQAENYVNELNKKRSQIGFVNQTLPFFYISIKNIPEKRVFLLRFSVYF